MLKGEGLVFIRHEHRKGISSKTDQPYEFANVTLSDGLESFKLNLDLAIIPMFERFKKGDKITITVDVLEGFNNRPEFLITDVVLYDDSKKIA